VSRLLLRGGRPWGSAAPADILIADGAIQAVGTVDTAVDTDTEVHDIDGHLVLPGLVDAHAHLDKTLWGGPWTPHSAGDALADRIANERRRRGELRLPRAEFMTALVEQMVVSGTTHVRTHTDIDPEVGLGRVEAVREIAGKMAGRISVSQVAFPQYGILSTPGTADLLERALREGVEAIGGIDPAGADGDPVRHLDVVFGLGERHGSYVDIHLHDGGSLGAWELELIAERTTVTGLAGKVTVSHAYALAQVDEAHQNRLIDRLARAEVGLTTCAVFDYPVPPLKKLHAAGVVVACGHDCIRDLWSPYGTGDMLDRAMHLAYRSTFRRDEDIELALTAATYGGARTLGLAGYGLTAGAPANLVVVAATTAGEAVVACPPRALVVHRGRVVARNGMLV
jgi:cytosine/creatinine deaminase